jgi:hypothetical protein
MIKLSTKYNKATKEEIKKGVGAAEHVYRCKDTHKLLLNAKSMKLISAADASYAQHPDRKAIALEQLALNQIPALFWVCLIQATGYCQDSQRS